MKLDQISSKKSWHGLNCIFGLNKHGLDKHEVVLKNMTWSWQTWHGLDKHEVVVKKMVLTNMVLTNMMWSWQTWSWQTWCGLEKHSMVLTNMVLTNKMWLWKTWYGLDEHDMVLTNMKWSWKTWHGLGKHFSSCFAQLTTCSQSWIDSQSCFSAGHFFVLAPENVTLACP